MLSTVQKRAVRRYAKLSLRHRRDRLADRAQLRSLLAERATKAGNVYIEVWSRDCDLTEVTELHAIRAMVPAYQRLERDVFDGAEGPVQIHVLTTAEAAHWRPYFRDRAAEMAGY